MERGRLGAGARPSRHPTQRMMAGRQLTISMVIATALVVGVRTDAGETARLAALRRPCSTDCGEHGTCDEQLGRCMCQAGWKGASCELVMHPACSLHDDSFARGLAPELRVPCAGLRKLSPVACECISQCLSSGEEVCGPGSMGCGYPWRPEAKRPFAEQPVFRRLVSRAGFLASLPCVATPPGVAARSTIPPQRGAVITTYANYLKVGYAANVSSDSDAAYPGTGPVPADGSLPVFGAGMNPTEAKGRGTRSVRPDYRAAGKETTPPLGSAYVAAARCGGCHGRGRCLALPDGQLHCQCVDGAYGTRCETVCTNDCTNDCSGKGRCVHGFCKCVAGWFGRREGARGSS